MQQLQHNRCVALEIGAADVLCDERHKLEHILLQRNLQEISLQCNQTSSNDNQTSSYDGWL